MCADCEREYREPADRRFHAEPTACPRCGPQLELWDSLGENLAAGDTPSGARPKQIRAGKIVALKGHRRFSVAGRRPQHGSGREACGRASIAKRSRSRSCFQRSRRFAIAAMSQNWKSDCSFRPKPRSSCSPERLRTHLAPAVAPGKSKPRGHASLFAAAPSASARAKFSGRRDERESERRADLHRRKRGRRTAARLGRLLPRARPADR